MFYGDFLDKLKLGGMRMMDTQNGMYGDLGDLGLAEHYMDEIYEIIHQIRLFDDFGIDEIRALCRYLHCYAAPRHYPILREGEYGDYMVLILTGSAEVRVQIPGIGNEKIAELGAGSTVGETSMIDGKPRFISCIATTPTDFAVLTRKSLNQILMQAPRLGNKLMLTLLQLLSARLREAYNPAHAEAA
jgi:CRP/FNR family cyclic AMP-dependent transcriptional regulator